MMQAGLLSQRRGADPASSTSVTTSSTAAGAAAAGFSLSPGSGQSDAAFVNMDEISLDVNDDFYNLRYGASRYASAEEPQSLSVYSSKDKRGKGAGRSSSGETSGWFSTLLAPSSSSSSSSLSLSSPPPSSPALLSRLLSFLGLDGKKWKHFKRLYAKTGLLQGLAQHFHSKDEDSSPIPFSSRESAKGKGRPGPPGSTPRIALLFLAILVVFVLAWIGFVFSGGLGTPTVESSPHPGGGISIDGRPSLEEPHGLASENGPASVFVDGVGDGSQRTGARGDEPSIGHAQDERPVPTSGGGAIAEKEQGVDGEPDAENGGDIGSSGEDDENGDRSDGANMLRRNLAKRRLKPIVRGEMNPNVPVDEVKDAQDRELAEKEFVEQFQKAQLDRDAGAQAKRERMRRERERALSEQAKKMEGFVQQHKKQREEIVNLPPDEQRIAQQRQQEHAKQLKQESQKRAQELEKRQSAVKQAFVHAWSGYEKHAWGHDEIRPVSNETNDSWNGWGVTMIDGLDTAILMNLDSFVQKARKHIAGLDFSINRGISFFETTIRYLGGLLSAFELNRDHLYLLKAVELADAMLPVFDSKTGLPYHEINPKTKKVRNPEWTRGSSLLAEVGSIQLEFKYLSHHTKSGVYAEKAQAAMNVIAKQALPTPGLYPVLLSPETGKFTSSDVSFGALADSFYEYLLKQWLLLDQDASEAKHRSMYDESVAALKKHLVFRSPSSNLAYIAEIKGRNVVHEMDHLACYVPGILALGAQRSPNPEEDLSLAADLAYTCARMYRDSPSGIGPEIVAFLQTGSDGNHWKPLSASEQAALQTRLESERSDLLEKVRVEREQRRASADQEGEEELRQPLYTDYQVRSEKYLLRPETLESLFVLYRVTGRQEYQDWAWDIFQAIERHCRTESAYSGLENVYSSRPKKNNSMQSFFLAETLKYLYLIFSPPDLLPLSDYVFNTEAHPLGVIRGGPLL